MIPAGSRVKIRAICKRDTFCTYPAKSMLMGRIGTVIDRPLEFDPKDSTFRGLIRVDPISPHGEPLELYFSSIQVKKIKE